MLSTYTLGALTLEGNFTASGNNVSTTGIVEIGYTPTGSETYTALTDWTPGNGESLSFVVGGTSFDFAGTIAGIEQGATQSIANVGTASSPRTFDVSSLTSTGVDVTGGSGLAVLQQTLLPGSLTPTLTPTSLALVNPGGGSTTNSYVSLQGNLGLPILAGFSVPVTGTNSVQMSPSTSAPGLTLVASTTTSFSAFGADFGSASLSVGYSSSANDFQISGSVSMATTSGDFSVSGALGTSGSPGVIVNSTGTLTQLILTMNGSVNARGLALSATNDVLQYQAASGSAPDEFQVTSGTITVGTPTSSLNFTGTFGSGNSPGLVLTGGDLTALDVTVSSSLNVAGLAMTAAGVELVYDSTGSTVSTGIFEIVQGTVTVGTPSSTVYFSGNFGEAASGSTPAVPGLVMTGSTLTSADITVTSSMNVAGMNLTVSNLQFEYVSDSSSIYQGDFLIQQGSVSFSTSAGDTSFAATFGYGTGTSALPGLVVRNNTLLNLYATVTSTVAVQGFTLNVNSLEFQYAASTANFEILNGTVSVSQGSLQFASATFGNTSVTPTVPGLVIQNGNLTGLDITINSSMTVDGMSLGITNVELVYAAVNGQTFGDFTIAQGGSISLSAGSSNTLSFSGLFGEAATSSSLPVPGLSMSDGNLLSFYIAINSNIGLGGSLTLSTSGLVFSYVTSSNTFEIPSGSVSVVDSNKDFSFTGTFGNTNGLGLVVTNGSLTALNITVTASLVAGDLNFKATDLNFSYAAPNSYEIESGSIAFTTSEGFAFTASFGLPSPTDPTVTLPGLVVQNGILTEVNAALTSSFTVAGLQVGVTDMAMSYTGAGGYAMYGTVDVNTTGVQFTGTIGQPSASPPVYGLVITNNVLKSLAITIDSTVSFGDMTVTANGLSFNYATSPEEEFTLYGSVSTSIAGVSLTGNLGTAALPGLTIVNGSLTELNLGVTANFTLFDLTCKINDLTFMYNTSGSSPEYVMYGSLSVSVGGNTMTATMGNSSDPGLIVQGSTVTQINMVISGFFQISGFGFTIQNAGLDYTATANSTQYLIFGTFTLTDVFTATVQLGTASSNPGITITNGVFQLDNFAFSLSNVAMGAFELNYVDISYASTNDVWSGAAEVTFPNGWAIGAGMTFINGALADINLSYAATGSSEGIAVGDTGIFVIGMTASLENLNEPENIVVSGSITADFGGKISIGGTTCTVFAATGSFTADSQELIISGAYYEGAYESNGHWNGILGSGTATVDLNWGAGVYTADINMSFYGGIFTINAEMAFNNSGDLGLIATASVNVPSAVPFIGGTKLGSMSFAFIYTASTNTGTVAAWTTVFGTCTTGFEYTFGSSSSGVFSLIGAGGVNSITNAFNAITSTSDTPPVYDYTYTVTIPTTVTGEYGVSVQASWPSNSGTQSLWVNGPNDASGTYYSVASPPPSGSKDSYDFLTQYNSATSQSMMVYGAGTSTSTALPPGTYTFEIQSSVQFSSVNSVAWSNQLYYEAPQVAITSAPSQALTFTPSMTGFAASSLAAGATVTLYADTNSSGYTGSKVGSFAFSANASGVLQGVPSIDLSAYSPGVPIYIYAIINDGVNSAVYSAYSTKIIPEPNLVGQILDQFGNPIAGVTVFLDLNNTGQYVAPVYSTSGSGATTTSGDPVAVTNQNGDYYFNDLAGYSTTDIGYSTFRVDAVMPNPSYTPITPSTGEVSVSNNLAANSASLVANFSINRLASISGSAYSDLNRNGVQVASDPALGGATVYLDAAGTGTYQTGDPICVTGPSGTFGFYQLTPTNYTAGIITSSTTTSASGATSTQQNYVVTQPASGTYAVPVTSDSQQLTGYTFGVISLATISGSITSQATTGATSSLTGTSVDITTPTIGLSEPAFTSFASTSGLVLNGATRTTSNTLSLIAGSSSNAAKSAWYSQSVPVTSGFASVFQMTMTGSTAGTAGLAFVMQNNVSTTATLGSTAYGYGGIAKSLAVVFDATDNQILLESGGNTSTSNSIALLTSGQLGFSLTGNAVYTVKVTYLPTDSSGDGTLNVYLSTDATNGGTPVISASVNLASLLGLGTGNNAYVGFTAGTSSSGLSASLTSWSFSALSTQTTTTDQNGNYSFNSLMPGTQYTVSQITPPGDVQSAPFHTQGIYSQSSLAALIGSVSSVTSGDFNGDGIPDVAYAYSLTNGSSAAYAIAYALGNGSGGFNAPVTVFLSSMLPTSSAPTLQYPSSSTPGYDAHIVAGHFDSTTREEIAYIATNSKGGTIVVTYDVESASVVNAVTVQTKSAPAVTSTAPLSLSTINNVAVGDLNNDGFDDIAVSTYGGVWTMVSWENLASVATSSKWINTPSTVATPFVIPSMGSTNGVVYDGGVTLADFNQDGNLDVGTLTVTYLEGSVYNNASESYTYSWSNTMTVQTSVQILYGNGSGVNYAATGSYLSSNGTTTTAGGAIVIQSYPASDVEFCTSKTLAAPTFPIPFGMASGDVSGDGVPDLELNGYNGSLQAVVFLITQSSPGTFTIADQFPIPGAKTFNINSTPGPNNSSIAGSLIVPSQISAIDLNSDGYNDVVAVEPNTGQLMLVTSQGQPLTSATTTTQTLQFANGALEQFAVADYGLNGYPDIVLPSPTSSANFIPSEVLNGTMNLGVYTYTPTNGQVLTSQNFSDIQFGTTSSAEVVSADSLNPSAGNVAASGLRHSSTSGSSDIVAGRVFVDEGMNGKFRANDPGISGVLVYIDTNNSGVFNPRIDPYITTNSQGTFVFSSLKAGHNYVIRTVNPAGMVPSGPVTVSFPVASTGNGGIVERYIGLKPQLFDSPTITIDPLSPLTIPLANHALSLGKGSKLQFTFNGAVPEGMTINPSTGELSWVAPASDEGRTVSVGVRVVNLFSSSSQDFETETVKISVNKQTSRQALVRAVYEALLSRVPSSDELNYWVNALSQNKAKTTNLNGTGISVPQFVSDVLHSTERSTDEANSLYLGILGRIPTAAELTSASAFLSQGGSSDSLTISLLTSQEFSAKYPSDTAYVTAVNKSLVPTGVPSSTAKLEVNALKAGKTRASLVQSIMRSEQAAVLKVTQLSNLYLGYTIVESVKEPLVAELRNGTLNSDQVTVKLLSSQLFLNTAKTEGIAQVVNAQNGLSPLYDRLNHLVVSLTGVNATRAQLDSLYKQQLDGMSWQQIASKIDQSQAAQTFRIQTQYRNLLGRSATPNEQAALENNLPPNNQTETLQVRILGSSEYRNLYPSNPDYINAVYKTLTGGLPTTTTLHSLTKALNAGASTVSFVQKVASSKAGLLGQINRVYADLLLQNPSQLDLQTLLKNRSVTDHSLNLILTNTSTFSHKQQSTRAILPS